VKSISILLAGALGAAVAFSAAAAMEADKKGPASVSESAPDKTGKVPQGKAGEATMPQKSKPASVSESAPDKTGKEKTAPKQADSKDMPNPKTPSSVSESKPSPGQK
jgi:hypothetical protein